MPSSEELLHHAASGHPIDNEYWPKVCDFITERINVIAATEFPQYQSSPESRESSNASSAVKNADSTATQDSEAPDKENAPPVINNSTQLDFFGQPKQQTSPVDVCKSLHTEILESLKLFSDHPPHTVQRLAELVLWPKREYRFLPPYLQAVGRVVSVSSNTSVFPLSFHQAASPPGLMGWAANGDSDAMLGSDESLGGALLTPIPWLTGDSASANVDRDLQDTAHRLQEQQALHSHERNGTLVNGEDSGPSGPSGHGQGTGQATNLDTELRDDGAVTQGELLRLEQEAGIVSRGHRVAEDASTERNEHDGTGLVPEETDETPHARGPDEIGVEDTGPPTGTGGVAGLMEASAAKAAVQADEATKQSSGESKMEVDEGTRDEAA